MPLMKIEALEKSYPGRKVLHGIDMEINPGRIVGLLGPNASGKTTLLKVLAGVLSPDAGSVTYPDGSHGGIGARASVSFLPDQMTFPAWMKTRDAFLFYKDMYPDYSEKRASTMADILQLPMDMPIKKLSKGMQERTALGLAFSRDARLYILDEPLGGIDPLGKAKVLESILTVQAEESSILLSTHLVKDVETIFDEVFFISEGKIIYQSDCEAARETSGKTIEQVYVEVFSRVKPV